MLDNGLFEMTARLGNVVNAVYAAHKHIPVVSAAMAGADKIVVGYRGCPSLQSMLVSARR